MNLFSRTELLLGSEVVASLRQKNIILFGVGGVGSWCAESLVRSGVEKLTIVDYDIVDQTNTNRQLVATSSTIGKVKVEVLKARLLDINPSASIIAICQVFSAETLETFSLEQYDCILDCIDSLSAKTLLLTASTTFHAQVYSSMGAALKVDPTKVRVAEFWKVRGCPLGAALRKKMRRDKTLPKKPILCVYSEELLENKGPAEGHVNGSVAHITAIFGFTLAGLVVEDVMNEVKKQKNRL